MSEASDRPARPAGPAEAIARAIHDHGPISFAEFMNMALYGPGGFYEQPPVGERGHFVTSPHVHPVFGELLARGLRAMWDELGRPSPFHLVEVGAGDGTLVNQVRRGLADVSKRYTAIERSAGARAALRRIDGVHVAASLESLDQHVDGVVFANELLDNLPFARVRGTAEGDVAEIRVGLEGSRFVEIESRCSDEVLELAPRLDPGEEATVPVGAIRFIDRLARILRRGYVLLIDYASFGPAWTHGYRAHRAIEDVLGAPGTSDITAGVDLVAISMRARALRLDAFPHVGQAWALRVLGYDEWADRERRRQADAQDRRSGREAVLAWSGRNEASLLVDPAGLGGFRWAVFRTRHLEWPDWLLRAAVAETDQLLVSSPGLPEEAEPTGRRRRRRRRRCP